MTGASLEIPVLASSVAIGPRRQWVLAVALLLAIGVLDRPAEAGEVRFTAHTISTLADRAYSVFAADVDGDGDIDVLSASFDDDKIAWYENTDGDGSFGPQKVVSTLADGAYSVFAADVDGDGDIDVLSASTGGKIAWYENTDGDGSFGPQKVVSTLAGGARSVFAADVDGDGDIDVLSLYSELSKIAWYENTDGDGSFGPQKVVSTAGGRGNVFAADVDGDGDIDVLSASASKDKIAWYENTDGDGNFGPQKVVSTLADGAHAVFAADVDGDGDIDVLSASFNDDKIAWYENTDGDGNFGPQRVVSTLADGAHAVFAADVDGDGDIDVLSASFNDDKIAWYENETLHRSASFPKQVSISTSANGANSVSVADVDGDGDLDALSTATHDNKIAWHENVSGDGSSWIESPISIAERDAGTVSAVDVDSDGDLDVLATSHPVFAGARIAWYENNGDGTTWNPQTIATQAAGSASAHAADIDNDGDLDVLSASGGDDTIAWHENENGLGTAWDPHSISTSADGATSVFAADLNGDGALDVLSASFNDDKIAWYENLNGDGSSWLERSISITADGASSVTAADIDRDGDIDVLSASFNSDTIVFHENGNGFGTLWVEHVVSAIADGVRTAVAQDLDGDGDLDVAAASFSGDAIAWYENVDGAGSVWTQHAVDVAADGAFSVAVGDLDGDGDADLISASFNDDSLSWYRNQGGQFALPTTSLAQGVLFDSQEEVLLQIDFEHRGRAGDSAIELATLELQLDDGAGLPLNATAANGLIDKLELFLDDGSGAFEASADTLVEVLGTLSPSPSGNETIPLISGDPNTQIDFGTSKRFFAVVTMTSNATAQTPDSFRVTHLTDPLPVSSTGRDALWPTAALTLEYIHDPSTGLVDTNLDSTSCHAPFDLELAGFLVTTTVLCESGTVLSAGTGLTVSAAGDLTIRAGQRLELRSGFRVEAGGRLTVEVDASLLP